MKITDSQLENLMKESSIEPNAQWQSAALENIKKSVTNSELEGINNSNLNFISHLMIKRKFLVMGIVFLSLLAVVLATGFTILNLRSNQKAISDKDILNKIALNNPGFAQSNTASSSAEGAAALATRNYADSKLIAPMPINQNPDFTYFFSRSETTRGPKFNACNYGVDQSSVIFVPKYESYNFNQGTNYYSKYVGYNEDGSVNSYNLSKSTNDQNTYTYENITYMGGSYAVRTSSTSTIDNTLLNVEKPSPDPMPSDTSSINSSDTTTSSGTASTPESSPEVSTVPDYFGTDSQILRTETIDGKNYYVVQYSYETNCAGYSVKDRWDSTPVKDNHTLYSLSYADVDTYQIHKTESYIDSVDASNLMETSTNTNESSNIDFSSVESNFNFEFNVPIKDVTVDTTTTIPTYDPESDINKALDFAKSKDLTVVLPTANAVNQYVYFNYGVSMPTESFGNSYYSDRDFYPAGDLGTKMYNSYNGLTYVIDPEVIVSLGTASYSIDNVSYNLGIYSKSDDSKKILNSLLWTDITNKSETDTTVTINGESVPAKLYSYQTEQSAVTPLYFDSRVGGAPSSCDGDTCVKKEYVLIFSYKNNKYTLQEYPFYPASTDAVYDTSKGVFKSLSASDATELDQIHTLISNSIKGTYVDGSGANQVEPAPATIK